MLDKIVSGILIIVGLITLFPLIVFFDVTRTVQLYGVPVEGDSLIIMMRHRGVLLSILGIALITAAFKPAYRIFAITLTLISKFAYIFLVFTSASHTPELRQVAFIDVGAAGALLLVALGLHFYNK